jgi:hypothetical protein
MVLNMIRVTIDLIPYGNENKKETIDTITIINKFTDESDNANYKVLSPKRDAISIIGYKRSKGIYKLLSIILKRIIDLDK